MVRATPRTEINEGFSAPGASAQPWPTTSDQLSDAEVFWVSTIRRDGQPHVTPTLAVWLDETLCFCTGPTEQKAQNLVANDRCTLTTGTNALGAGVDVVVEGVAVRVTDAARLQRIADVYEAKYGPDWHFDVVDGGFVNEGRPAHVFAVEPVKVFAFRKGEYSQTRYRFD